MFDDALDSSYPGAVGKALKDLGMIILGDAVLKWDIDTGIPIFEAGGDIALNILKGVASGIKMWGLIDLLKICIIALVCLYAAVRVFITMILLYLKIFVEVILGPIYILLGSLPGNGGSTSGWFKRVSANVLSFVVIYIIINLSRYIVFTNINSSGLTFFNTGSFNVDWIISFQGILVIAGYLFAAGAPGIVNEMLSVQPSRGISQAVEGAKKALTKFNLG